MDLARVRKGITGRYIVSLVCCLCLFNLAGSTRSTFKHYLGSSPQRVEVSFQKDVRGSNIQTITLKDYQKLVAYHAWTDMSYASDLNTEVIYADKVDPVKVCLTNENYEKFKSFKWINGCCFSKDANEKGRNVAVISDKLAEKLFVTYEVIGNEIELFSERYKIVGVYRSENSILSFLGSDGLDTVYIPFKSYENMRDLPINRLMVKDNSFSPEKSASRAVIMNLVRVLDLDPSKAKVEDYYPSTLTLFQFAAICILFMGFYALWLLGGHAVRYLSYRIGVLRGGLKDMYFKELLWNRKLSILQTILAAAVFLGGAVFLVVMLKFKFYVPQKYVPQDNIFDFGFYWNAIQQNIQAANTFTGFFPTELSTLYSNALKLESILVLFAFITFVWTVSLMKLLKHTVCGFFHILKSGLLAFLVSLLVTALLTLLLGMDFYLESKGNIVVFAVLFLLYQRRGLQVGDSIKGGKYLKK